MRFGETKNMHDLEELINSFQHSVWIESPNGERYNLKKDPECYLGFARLLKDKKEDFEFYTNSCSEGLILARYLLNVSA